MTFFDLRVEGTTVLVVRVLYVGEHSNGTGGLVTLCWMFCTTTTVVGHLVISEHTLRVAFRGRGTLFREVSTTFRIARGVFVEGGEYSLTIRRTTFSWLLGTWSFFAALFELGGVLL